MAKDDTKKYDQLDKPYNNYLLRNREPEIATNTLPNNSDPGDSRPVKTGSAIEDVYLKSWIKSSFYKPQKQGFFIDGRDGYFEINGQLVIGGGETGTGISFSSNDMFLLEDTVGGINPVSGNVSSIFFVRKGDSDPYNPVLSQQPRAVIQKRKGVNSNNENVLEIFYDQDAKKDTGIDFNGIKLNNGGASGTYVIGDILTVVQAGGSGGTIQVLDVAAGKVSLFQVLTPGTGYSIGTGLSTTGGGGSGCTVDIISLTGKNYIFIGRKGGGNSISYTDVMQLFSKQTVQMGLDSFNVPLIQFFDSTYTQNGIEMNSGGTRSMFLAVNNDVADPVTPTTLYGNSWKGHGFVFADYTKYILTMDDQSVILGSNTYPAEDLTYNLGTSSYHWNNIYGNQFYIGTGGLYLYYDGVQLASAGGFKLGGDLLFPTSFNSNIKMTLGGLGLVTLNNGGTGGTYAVGNVLTLVQSGATGGQVTVDTVSGNQVATFHVTNVGSGYSSGTVNTTGGGGSGCTLDISTLSGTRTYTQQQITYKDGSGTNQTKWFLAS